MKKSRPIMFVGTGSDVGKSILCTGICRILKQEGFSPAPFKGQNMSLNSRATPDGYEIGAAQAVQAEAAGIESHTNMNPVLLKPTTNSSSQVVLHGKPKGESSAQKYFDKNNKSNLYKEVLTSFKKLSEKYSPIVIEGAGSISELNLKDRDITNMKLAIDVDAATYIIADIDKGGIFANVYGSVELLNSEEKKQIKGIIINKFRGDMKLFEEGKKKMEEITGLPVVGIIPYFNDIYIDEEDSVSIDRKKKSHKEGKMNVAVVLLNRMSNFTDFNVLERDDRVHLFYTDSPDEIKESDVIIIPGSKNTISDLIEIRKKGLVEAVLNAYENGKKVVGICGGYQMMGKTIEDPDGVEGDMSSIPAMGLLPVKTILEKEKTTEQCTFKYKKMEKECEGYEIHMGKTYTTKEPNPLNFINGNKEDGFCLNDRCWGTYIHGILDNRLVVDDLLSGSNETSSNEMDHATFKQQQYDNLAEHLRNHLDLDKIHNEIRI